MFGRIVIATALLIAGCSGDHQRNDHAVSPEAPPPAAVSPVTTMDQLDALGGVCGTPGQPARVWTPPERRAEFERCRQEQSRCGARVGGLRGAMDGEDADLRRESARVLGRIVRSHGCDADAADPCAWISDDPGPSRTICPELAFAMPLLMRTVTDADWQVGLGALDGLALARPREEDIEPLARWLREPPPDDGDGSRFRMGVATALGRAGARAAPATEALAWVAAQPNPNDSVSVVALRALAEIGPDGRAAVPTLVTLMGHESWSVRHAALVAMRSIAPHDARARAMVERGRDDSSEAVRDAARALGSAAGASPGASE